MKPKAKRLSFPRLDKKGIPLRELITVHKQFASSQSLARNLGDGFLCETNPVFANIRSELLRCGYQFSLRDKFHYFSFPLMCLDRVLEEKLIPYRDNFFWLEELDRVAPKIFSLTELKRSELQFNYLFHESAHCIAHSHLFPGKKIAAIRKDGESLVRIMIGEAFANTVEALSALFIEGEIGNYFLDANCHFRTSEREVKVLALQAKKHGISNLAFVLFGAFLYSNFMLERADSIELGRLARFAGKSRKSDIEPIVKVGLSLSTQFRTTTTQLHLLKMGYRENLDSCFRVDPVAALLKPENKSLRQQVEGLLGTMVRGI